MIRHAALFRLNHPKGSQAETDFLSALADLKTIPNVGNFSIDREVSAKNSFDYVVSMTFDTQSQYDAYNVHPSHVTFVNTRWIPEVAEFFEHDAAPL